MQLHFSEANGNALYVYTFRSNVNIPVNLRKSDTSTSYAHAQNKFSHFDSRKTNLASRFGTKVCVTLLQARSSTQFNWFSWSQTGRVSD